MKLADEIAEKLLIDIHWQGVKPEHPEDLKWLEMRVDALGKEIAEKLEPVVDALRDLKFLAAECQWPLRSDERGIAHGKIVDALALLEDEG